MPATSSSTGLSPIRSLPKTPIIFWRSCSKRRASCDTYHTQKGYGTSFDTHPMFSHHRLALQLRTFRYRWTLVCGQLGAPLYPNADGSQAMGSIYVGTSKTVHFSFPSSLLTIAVGLVSGYQTSFKVVITTSTMGIERPRLGERRRHTYVST